MSIIQLIPDQPKQADHHGMCRKRQYGEIQAGMKRIHFELSTSRNNWYQTKTGIFGGIFGDSTTTICPLIVTQKRHQTIPMAQPQVVEKYLGTFYHNGMAEQHSAIYYDRLTYLVQVPPHLHSQFPHQLLHPGTADIQTQGHSYCSQLR